MNKPQLIEATKTDDVNRVQALIEGGEDLEQKDDYGWTALNWAAGRGDLVIVRLLLEAGANAVNSRCGASLFSFPRAAWECSRGALRRESRLAYRKYGSDKSGRSASCNAFPRGAWERGQLV